MKGQPVSAILRPRPFAAIVARAAFLLATVFCAALTSVAVAAAGFADREGTGLTVLTKPGGLFAATGTFSAAELAEIEGTVGSGRVFAMRRNGFRVSGSVSFGGRIWSSELFLESVPGSLLPREFEWREDSREVPILIADEFLLLYNTSFAPAWGLPQASPDMLNLVPIRLDLLGAGGRRQFTARIVGTTDRVMTVLVPDAFLARMNAELAGGGAAGDSASPSKLLVEPGAAGDLLIALAGERGYLTDSQRLADNPVFALGSALLRGTGIFLVAFAAICLAFVLTALRLQLRESAPAELILVTWGYDPAALRWFRIRHELGWAAACAAGSSAVAVAAGALPPPLAAGAAVTLSGIGAGVLLSCVLAGAGVAQIWGAGAGTEAGAARKGQIRVKSSRK